MKDLLPLQLDLSLSTFRGEVDQADVIVIGVPCYIKASSFNPYIKASDALRIMKNYVEDNSLLFQDRYYSSIKILDLGDVYSRDYDAIQTDIATIVKYVIKRKLKAIYIGGEHTFTYYLLKCYKPDNLIFLDAHLDMKDSFYHDKFNNTTFLRRINEEVDLNIYVIGARAYSQDEFEYVRRNDNIYLLDPKDIANLDLRGETYISLDIDILDPTYMSSTVYLEPGGIDLDALLNLLKTILEKVDYICGFDIMEYNPRLDRISDAITVLRIFYEVSLLLTLKRINR